ncbi:MAG: dienelactone hydrolase [Verrucomicrobiales bacterium]|nr:dienelactone hydrolase [Verrucomicrobiales bacterium]
MKIIDNEFTDVATPSGPMRTYLFRPETERAVPAVILFSEIFQVTHQMRRAASIVAGHGFVVAVPEIFHDLLPGGKVLPYNDEGTAEGRRVKVEKTLGAFDADAGAVITMLRSYEQSSAAIGTMGFCIGGHLAVRAGFNPEVGAVAAYYPSGLHSGQLGKGEHADSLDRLGEIRGECAFYLGQEDPLIPADGRNAIRSALEEAGTSHCWHEFQTDHAFMRDAGPSYDAEVAQSCCADTVSLFRRNLH